MVENPDNKQNKHRSRLVGHYKIKTKYNNQKDAEIHKEELSVQNYIIPYHRVNDDRGKPAIMRFAFKITIEQQIKRKKNKICYKHGNQYK
jgi:hypothetical protein